MLVDDSSHSRGFDPPQAVAIRRAIGIEVDFRRPPAMRNMHVWRRMVVQVNCNAKSADPQERDTGHAHQITPKAPADKARPRLPPKLQRR